MKMRLLLGLILAMFLVPGSAFALLIDNFNTDQSFTVAPGGSVLDVVNHAGDPYILGSERDVNASATGGSSNLLVNSDAGGTGSLL